MSASTWVSTSLWMLGSTLGSMPGSRMPGSGMQG